MMTLATFIVLAWMISACFWMLPKHFSFADHMILWFANSMVIISFHTILTMGLGRISNSEDNALFVAFLLERSFIEPMLLLIFENIAADVRKAVWKACAAVGILAGFLVLKYLSVRLQLIAFVKFNYVYTAVMYGLILSFSHLVAYLLRRGGTHADHRI